MSSMITTTDALLTEVQNGLENKIIGYKCILTEKLKDMLLGEENKENRVVVGNPLQHNWFIKQFVNHFEELVGLPIIDYDENHMKNIKCVFQEHSPDNIWNYEIVFNDKYYYYCCNNKYNMNEIVKHLAYDEEELFLYNPIYVYGFLKPEYRFEYHKDIEYPEPDLETDEEDIPLFDTDDCPCCMEKFGITEKQELVGNHPVKKILKTTKTICVKRNTYCGHPICITCFKTICNSNNVSCPMCRVEYEETGDVYINEYTTEITEKCVFDMIESKDDMLLDMVDYDKLIEQSVIADGYAHLLHMEGFTYEDDMFFIGLDTTEMEEE